MDRQTSRWDWQSGKAYTEAAHKSLALCGVAQLGLTHNCVKQELTRDIDTLYTCCTLGHVMVMLSLDLCATGAHGTIRVGRCGYTSLPKYKKLLKHVYQESFLHTHCDMA